MRKQAVILLETLKGCWQLYFLQKLVRRVSRVLTSQMSNVASKPVSNNRPPVPFGEVTDTKMSFKYDAFL